MISHKGLQLEATYSSEKEAAEAGRKMMRAGEVLFFCVNMKIPASGKYADRRYVITVTK
jgi:hypothetical protein